MKYIFETEAKNYEDFSSGRVLYNQSGATSFPVRLGSEIYQRCREYLREKGVAGPYTIYDPCCGGAYLLTTLGFLHGEDLAQILASDIDQGILGLAQDNLSLLTLAGIDQRINQIKEMIAEFNKTSHEEALQSAQNLRDIVEQAGRSPEVRVFQADALKLTQVDCQVDLLITDVPYGNIVEWSGDGDDHMGKFLESLLTVLRPTAVVAVVADKKQKVEHDRYHRLKKFKIGKRQITILEPK